MSNSCPVYEAKRPKLVPCGQGGFGKKSARPCNSCSRSSPLTYLADEPLPVALAPLGRLHCPKYVVQNVRIQAAELPPSELPLLRLFILQRHFFWGGLCRQVARNENLKKDTTSGTTLKIKLSLKKISLEQ